MFDFYSGDCNGLRCVILQFWRIQTLALMYTITSANLMLTCQLTPRY